MILSKMVRFYGTIAFAFGWTKTIQKRNVWKWIFLETDDDIINKERTYRSLSETLNKLTFASCCQLPMSKSSFLPSFNFNRSLTNQSSMFPMHSYAHIHSTKGNALVLVHLSVICIAMHAWKVAL